MVSNLTDRFENALIFTTRLHASQLRKGSQIPYIAHLLGVAALVLEAGGDEDLAIAALLHDAVEDQGGVQMLVEIRDLFGDRVAEIVDACSDAYTNPKPPWRARKEAYLVHLKDNSTPEVRLVSLADKLHNARSILRDLCTVGNVAWDKFKGGKDGTLWYYRSLIAILEQYENGFLLGELKRVVDQIERVDKPRG